MKFIAVVFFLYFTSASAGKSVRKFKDESAILNKKLINKPKPYAPPAIIAIEIVDPNENKTSKASKNSKRTIDNSLGYGYHQAPPPQYQVYKYSQHDIPPYRGSPNFFSGGVQTHHYEIQKSLSYNLPSQTFKAQNLNQYYQPGTTIYSTVNTHGQVEGLTSQLPHHNNEPQVPVIILRVLPSQLNDPSAVLHPNLPQSHPLASVVNNIDVQALLSKYVQNVLLEQQHQQPQQHYQEQPQYHYQQPMQEYQYIPQQQQQQYHGYSNPDELLTHENYPKDTHTRVIFRTDKNKKIESSHHNTQTKTIQIAVPEGAYSAVHVETPDMQYAYTSPGEDGSQQYYYQEQAEVPQYYYQNAAEAGYQQVEDQQQLDYSPSVASDQPMTPYNYHAHQKRSKKTKNSKSKQSSDVLKLETIRV